jgi:hypothetical protein
VPARADGGLSLFARRGASLVNRDQYLAPTIARLPPVSAHTFMLAVNLLLIPGYFDIALRDFGLSLGALALARLAHDLGR